MRCSECGRVADNMIVDAETLDILCHACWRRTDAPVSMAVVVLALAVAAVAVVLWFAFFS